MNNVTKERQVIYNSISQSDAINEARDFSQYTFHEALNPHMTAGAVGRYAFRNSASGSCSSPPTTPTATKWCAASSDAGKEFGVEMLGDMRHPLGTTDFSSFLPRVQALKPDILVHQQFRPRSADRAEAGDRLRHEEADQDHHADPALHRPHGRRRRRRSRASSAARRITGGSRTSCRRPRRSTTASARRTAARCRPTTARWVMPA